MQQQMKIPQLNHTSTMYYVTLPDILGWLYQVKSIDTIKSIKVLEVFKVHLYTLYTNSYIYKNYQMQPSFSMRYAS